jgi:hypothetical protein
VSVDQSVGWSETKIVKFDDMFRGSDDYTNTARAEGPLPSTTHKVGCDISKSTDRMSVCVSCNKIKNLSYL